MGKDRRTLTAGGCLHPHWLFGFSHRVTVKTIMIVPAAKNYIYKAQGRQLLEIYKHLMCKLRGRLDILAERGEEFSFLY